MLISLPVQNGRHFKNSYFSHLTDFSAMAPYPIFFRALKTIIMPNFILLTESEQFKHISALLPGKQKVSTFYSLWRENSEDGRRRYPAASHDLIVSRLPRSSRLLSCRAFGSAGCVLVLLSAFF